AEAVGESDPGAGDGSGARAAIGLQHIAIDCDLPLAERLEIDGGAKGTADQPLNFDGAATLLTSGGLAAGAFQGGARQHAVFSRDPAAPLPLQPGRQPIFQRGRDQHMGIAEFYEAGPLGVFDDPAFQRHGAQLIGGTAAWPHGKSSKYPEVIRQVDGSRELVGAQVGRGKAFNPAFGSGKRRLSGAFRMDKLVERKGASLGPSRSVQPDHAACRACPAQRAFARYLPANRRKLSRDRRAGRVTEYFAADRSSAVPGVGAQRDGRSGAAWSDLCTAHLGRPVADRARPALSRRRLDADRRPPRGRTTVEPEPARRRRPGANGRSGAGRSLDPP